MAAHSDPPVPESSAARDMPRCPAEAFALLVPLFALASVERVAALYLAEEKLLALVDVAAGDPVSTVFPMARILRDAILRGADGILLAHNHPAGDPAPSPEDLRVTRRFAAAAAAIGIRLVDHVIVARGGCASLRMMGLL